MQTLFLPTVILLSSFIFTLIALTFYSLWHDENKKKSTSTETPEKDNDLEEKAQQVLHHAQEEAHHLLAEAELAGIRTVAQKKINTKDLEKSYEQDLTTLSQAAVKELTIASTEIKKRYDQFVTESENIIGHHISENQTRLDSHIVQIIEANEKSFQLFLQNQQRKLDEAFNKEISQVESAVTNYSKKRLELVDTHIVDLVTQATKITLGRAIDFKQHTEIILEALEEAKSSGFFGQHGNK